MPQDVVLVWDDAAVELWSHHSVPAQAMLDRVAAIAVVTMKRLTPVSPVFRVYATGGAVVRGGRRSAGDFPLRPSGHLRTSVRAFREPDGSRLIGPTASYAPYVNNDTVPHLIISHGAYPLRNRATGQVFGRVVHHPGTRGAHFVERTADALAHVRERVG